MTASAADRRARAASAATPEPAAHRARLRSLDVLRGLTVAFMILVNSPGASGQVYPLLTHARWNGWTPTDLIFPFFLFIVGVSTALSLAHRRAHGQPVALMARHVMARGLILFALGLLATGFPTYDFASMRSLGVLQRIAIAYVCVALLLLHSGPRAQLAAAAAVLLGYWVLLALVPSPDGVDAGADLAGPPARSLAAWVDRLVLGERVPMGEPLDPEGLLSTPAAVTTALCGALAGRWIDRARTMRSLVAGLVVAGIAAALLGLLWGLALPLNKHVWTSSFALFAAGSAALALGICAQLVDRWGATRWARPFELLGLNALIAYLGSGAVDAVASFARVDHGGARVTAKRAVYEMLFGGVADPRLGALLYALAYVLLWVGIVRVLERRKIRLTI